MSAGFDVDVLAAMAKWPGVPDVYGWLRLDERGRFLLRAGDLGRGGQFESIGNAALERFIARNYGSDARGCWFFQNGPQRVFAELAATPWVFRLDHACSPATHAGQSTSTVDAVLLDEHATLLLATPLGPGIVDDRDAGRLIERVCDAAGNPVSDDRIEGWLANPRDDTLHVELLGRRHPVTPVRRSDLAGRFGFEPRPMPPPLPARQ